MSIINTAKPSTSIANLARVQSYETWGSILTTWASETRTWAECISLMSNVTKPSTSITNTAKPS